MTIEIQKGEPNDSANNSGELVLPMKLVPPPLQFKSEKSAAESCRMRWYLMNAEKITSYQFLKLRTEGGFLSLNTEGGTK